MREEIERPSVFALCALLLRADFGLAGVAVIYALAIAVLTLAVPISVQVLIETVANTAVTQSVVILASALAALLTASGLLVALQLYALEIFERRFFSRVSAELCLRLINADHAAIERINRDDMMNRFFEVVSIKKNLPNLLVNGLPLLLQTIVGFVVVSFYHPLFLGFSIVYAFAAWFIWRSVDRPAMVSSVEVSKAKYDMANWLETLARSNGLFRSTAGFNEAIKRTEELTGSWLGAHRRLFRFTFTQAVGFLILYALGSAALLGIGGWLVIQGQLSLGQLVAAELILSAVFAGLSRAEVYLDMYYEVSASLAKLGELWQIPVEEESGQSAIPETGDTIRFQDVRVLYRGGEYRIDFDVPHGQSVLIAPQESITSRMLTDLLQNFREPQSGQVLIGEHSVEDFDLRALRQNVAVIDSPLVPELGIAEFFRMADPQVSVSRMRQVLAEVGLANVVFALEDGLERQMTPYGYPLSVSETVRLKIAYALLLKPKVLVLTPLFDTITHHDRQLLTNMLHDSGDITLMCITNRRDLQGFDRYLYIEAEQIHEFTRLEQLSLFESTLPSRAPKEDQPAESGGGSDAG